MPATGHAKWVGDIQGGEGTIDTGTGVVAGTLHGGIAIRRRQGNEPRGAARRRSRRLLLDGADPDPRKAGHKPESVETEAKVYLRRTDTGFEIHKIDLETVGTVPDITEEEFVKHAEVAKAQLPRLQGALGARDHARGEACRLTAQDPEPRGGAAATRT